MAATISGRCGCFLPVFALFLLSFVSRIVFINKGFFHHDAILLIEAVEQSVTQKTLVPFLDGRYALVAFHIPFYLLCLAFGLPVDLTFNILTALLASLSVVLLYLLAMELTGDRFCAFASALLFAITPVYFAVSTHTMAHPLSVCLILLAFYLVMLAERRPVRFFYCAAAVSLLLGISTRFPNILLIPSFLIVYFKPGFVGGRLKINKSKFSRNMISLGIPLGAGLLWLFVVQKDALVAKAGYDAFLGFFSPVLRLGVNNILTNIGLVGCALLLAGIGLSFRERDKAWFVALFLWLVVMFFFYGNVRTYADRFYSIIYPLIATYMALSLKQVARYSRVAAWCVLLYLTATMFYVVYPLAKDRHNYSGPKEYALWLGQRTEPSALVIVMDDSVFVRYYGHRRTVDHPQGSVELAEEWAGEVKGHLRAGVPVYLMESGLSYDPGQIIRETIFRHFHLIYMGAHLTEDYHDNGKSFLQRTVYEQQLFRLLERK